MTPPANDPSHLIGKTLAERYTVIEVLGEGGAATVFRAHDKRHDRQVAIKVLRAELGAAIGAERFHQEISLAARLSHPHIVPLLDDGQVEGLLYYVMPLITGSSLRAHLHKQGQLGIDETIQIARDVAVALDYAHQHGVVHRDIKPENVLLEGSTAVVTDFGIAKMLGEPGPRRPLTQTGLTIGTLYYMSPEQGGGEAVDGRADVYALGCMVYEMFTGEPPYNGATTISILAKHASDAIPAVRRLRPTVSAALDDVIAGAMAKSPADRFPTATAFTTALERARAATSGDVEARRAGIAGYTTPTAPVHVKRMWPRWMPVSLGLAALLAAALLSPSMLSDITRSDTAGVVKSIAVLPFDDVSQAKDQEYFAMGMADELLNALSKLPDLRIAARTSSFALRGSTLSTKQIGDRLNVGSLLTGSIRKEGTRLRITAQLVDVRADSVIWSDSFDRELRDVFAVQEEIAQTIAGKLQVLGAEPVRLVKEATRDPEAYQLYLRGRVGWRTRTATSLQQAVNYFKQAIARDSNFAEAYAGLADTYNVIGLNFYGSPGEYFIRGREAAQKAVALDSTSAEAHAAAASSIAFLDRDWERADAEFRRAIALDPRNPSTYYFYSIFLTGLSRHDSSIALARTARELDRLSSVMAQGVGIANVMAARFQEAKAPLEEAIAIAPDYYFPHAWYSIALARTGDTTKALAESRLAMQLAPDNMLVRVFKGQVHALLGQRDSAISTARALERLAPARPIPNVMIARLYAILGDTTPALAALERGLRQNEAQLNQLRAPGFESLRGNTRFEQLVRQLRLQ